MAGPGQDRGGALQTDGEGRTDKNPRKTPAEGFPRLTCGDGSALYFVGPPRKVPQGLDTALQVDEEGVEEGLARVQGFQGL